MPGYEYKTVEMPMTARHDIMPLRKTINEYASDEWRFVDTVEIGGTTAALIFERPETNTGQTSTVSDGRQGKRESSR